MLRITLAGLRAHKLRLLLTTVAITLGVGFIAGTFVLTDTMNKGVAQTFAKSADKVDFAVLPDGDATAAGLSAETFRRIRALPGVTDAQGMVNGEAALVGKDGKAVGDYPTIAMSVPSGPLLRYGIDQGRAPSGGGETVLGSGVAEREGFTVGDTVTILDQDSRPHRFAVAGLVDFGIDPKASFRGAVGFDTATAHAMTGERTYREIDVAGGDRAAIEAAAGPAAKVYTGEELGAELARSAGADTAIIQAGLLIFALVAMLVSALVIYNTFAILVAQRMREMALLRCLGATRRDVFGGVLAESAVVGLIGSLLGLAAGVGLGGGALVLMHELGARVQVAAPTLTPRTIVAALAVGVTVTVLSALAPARAATRVAPVAALRAEREPDGGRFRLGRPRTVLAALLAAIGVALGGLGSLVLDKGQAAMFLVAFAGGVFFLAVITVMPALVRPLGRLAGAVPARLGGVPGRLAVANARRSPRRTATTTIALTVGIGLMSLFSVVAASAKATTEHQLEEQFPAEFMVQTQSMDGQLPQALAGALSERPEVSAVDPVRRDGEVDRSALYIRTPDDVSASEARQAVEGVAQPYPAVRVTSAAEFKETMTEAIDMVLIIFTGLLALAVVIALFGIANTLTLSVVERTRESALLRALGLTERQLRRMLSIEALVMTVIGALTGVVLGIAFGWAATNAMADSARFSMPYPQVAGFVVLAGAAGTAAAVLPGRRAARTSIVESLAEE